MKNGIEDLRNHLFAQLERLGDEDLTGEKLDAEIERAKSVKGVADSIINTAKEETNRIRVLSDTQMNSGTSLMKRLEGPKE